MSIKSKFISGFSWQALNVLIQVVLQTVFIFVLARLISEEDFGVMAIALVVVGFIEIFSQVGIGPALIQRKDIKQEHINGAFYISIGLGLLFTALLYFGAPYVADFYSKPELINILRVIGLSFIISAIAIVPKSLIIKEMQFKSLLIATLIAMTIGNIIIGLYLAYAGYGYWAYVFALLSQNVLMTICYWVFKPVRISTLWSKSDTLSMIKYGGGSTLFNMFNYAATKIDLLVVGKFSNLNTTIETTAIEADAGSTWQKTGIYDRSIYIMSLPITILGKLSDSVMFSGLSLIQDDQKKFQRAVLSAIYHIALLVIPGSVFMVFFSEEIVVTLLGEKYLKAAPILQILFISVAFRSLIKIGDSIVRAIDAVYKASVIKIIFFVLVGCGAYFGLNFGLKGVAWSLVISVFIQFIMMWTLCSSITSLSLKKMFKKTVPGILLAFLVLGGSLLTKFVLSWVELGFFLKLIIAIILNAVVLLSAAISIPWIFKQGHDNLLSTIAEKLPKNRFTNKWK